MKILLSPAKKLRSDGALGNAPVFAKEASSLRKELSAWGFDEAKRRYKASEKIVEEAREWNRREEALGRAIFAYDGIAFRYLSPETLDEKSLEYLQSRLWILSGLYGFLRPFDQISAYRLEMQTPGPFQGEKDLYVFWRGRLEGLLDEETVWNLASEEYAKLLRPLLPKDRFIDFFFAEKADGKLVEKGVYAKMARGAMVRFLSERKAESIDEAKAFTAFDYQYSLRESTPNRLVFIKGKDETKGKTNYDPDW